MMVEGSVGGSAAGPRSDAAVYAIPLQPACRATRMPDMEPREIDELIARIEHLKVKQAEIEEMQRKMAEQAGSVQKAIDAEAEMLRRLRQGLIKKNESP